MFAPWTPSQNVLAELRERGFRQGQPQSRGVLQGLPSVGDPRRVFEQLGLQRSATRKPTTTLMYCAHWFPSGDKRYIDRLEALRTAGLERAERQW